MTDKFIAQLEDKVLKRDFMLHSMLEITKAINLNKDVDEWMRIFAYILREQLNFKKAVLYAKQDDWKCIMKFGVRGKWLDIEAPSELHRFHDITEIVSSGSKLLQQFDYVVPVHHNSKPLAYLLLSGKTGWEELTTSVSSGVSFVQTLTNIIVVAIENRRMSRLGIVQERLSRELEVASALQKYLFPSDLPSNRKMDISARYFPRHEVGGDYYDFIPLGDDEYFICIADVSGKGVGAAMLMANFQAIVRTIFSYQRFDFHILVDELNRKVGQIAKGEFFITCFMAIYHSTTRSLRYVNAGHNQPFITTGRKSEFLSKGCVGLGMMEEIPSLKIGHITLRPNTTLVLYTDGVVELNNPKEDMFGVERLIKLIHNFYPLKMEDLNNLIFAKLDEFREGEDFVDDTAIFCCRFF
jgi:sigma-B regulation protein RsbU (phosphoserine phosphatase)